MGSRTQCAIPYPGPTGFFSPSPHGLTSCRRLARAVRRSCVIGVCICVRGHSLPHVCNSHLHKVPAAQRRSFSNNSKLQRLAWITPRSFSTKCSGTGSTARSSTVADRNHNAGLQQASSATNVNTHCNPLVARVGFNSLKPAETLSYQSLCLQRRCHNDFRVKQQSCHHDAQVGPHLCIVQ